MADARLPTHLEVSALIRRVSAEGGFATVLARGEQDAGTLLVVLRERDGSARLFERMPSLDGPRVFTCTREAAAADSMDLSDYLERRHQRDPDLWVVELDIAQGERFIVL